MSKNKAIEFKNGDHVTVCPQAAKCPNKSGKITSRTGLSIEELMDGSLRVTEVPGNGQLHLKHPRLSTPFILHSKFIVPHTATAQ